MNIFGLGGAELVVIILIMLVVAGPQRMLRWAYVLGQWTAKLRQMWREVAVVIQKEIDDAGMDIKVPTEMPTRQNINKAARDALKPYTEQIEAAEKEFRDEIGGLQADVKAFEKDLEKADKELKAEALKPSRSAKNGLGSWSATGQGAVGRSRGGDSDPTPSPSPGSDGESGTDDDTADPSDFGTWSRN